VESILHQQVRNIDVNVCLFHQQLHNLKKKHGNAQWRSVFVYVGCLILSQPTGLPCKHVCHRCRRLTLCSVSSISAACVCPVVLFNVTVILKKRNVIICYVGAIVSLKSVPVLCLYLEVSYPKPSSEPAIRRKNIKLHVRLWHLKLTHFTVYNSSRCLGSAVWQIKET
jgi:hypothetical protein